MGNILRARLVEKRRLSSDVCWFTFESLERPFTSLEPGAHIDVHLGPNLVRNYSLCAWDHTGSWLSVAVKREPEGRGGSVAMHNLDIGTQVQLGGPRNHFPLLTGPEPIVLVAGGIGITPLYAMATELRRSGRDFSLHYMVRNRELAAFSEDLNGLHLGTRYRLHCADIEGIPDFRALVETYPASTQYYVCGPGPMLDGFLQASHATGRGTVYFERFAPAPTGGPKTDNRSFEIVLKSSGDVFQVPEDRSILHVLRQAGYDIDYSCAEGLCGTCITDVIDGEIDHRDHVLTDDERKAGDCMCICVSRAKSNRLTLDL